MLSFEISNVSDHGPQHSTPVKESFLSKIQKSGNYKHTHKTGSAAQLSDGKVNDASHRHLECELSHHVDDKNYISSKSDFLDSSIDISMISEIPNISVHGSYIFQTAHGDGNVTICSNHLLDCPPTDCKLPAKKTLHQHQHAPIDSSPPTPVSFKHGKQENDNTFNRLEAVRNVHVGTQYSRPLPSDCFSDSDLSRQSTPPRSSSSIMKVTLSPSKQKMVKAYRRARSSSLPRSFLTDLNICNSVDYNLPGCSLSDFRRTPTVYIEQDIINKQRQEIQLLMEELGNRDQELNDLVVSHQKQVKAWESDNEKLVALQGRLNHYEEELKNRESQLKETLSEMARVNEQREVDAGELKKTQNEMIRLAERISENSLYIKEMEAQNQKLSYSLRDFIATRQSFSAREQELLLIIDEKDTALSERQKEMEKMVEHIKYLECQYEQLGERNNNTMVESVNWKKKYFQIKEEADRLSADCRQKEDNVQKMTQQLHESLQQAIALQKALFTSCEREKCKEEVMYSLRKQHKRTMQELQNIRELYDRLSRDTTLYHLSVKEKDSAKDVKKNEDLERLSKKCRGDSTKHDEDADKRKQGGSRKHDSNTSKLKHPEASEQSFLVKETKERKQSKEEKSVEKNTNKTADKSINCVEPKICKTDSSKSHKGTRTDEAEDHGSKPESASQNTSQKVMERTASKVFKNEQQTSTPVKPTHITTFRNASTITSSTSVFSEDVNLQRSHSRKSGTRSKACQGDSKCSDTEPPGHENTSKNADFKDTRSLSSSHMSTVKSVQSRTTSPFPVREVPVKHDISFMQTANDVGGYSSSDASNLVSPSRFDDELTPADSDGMCHELQRDFSRIQHLDRLSPMLEVSGFESRSSKTPSNSLAVPKKSSFLKKDKSEKKEPSTPIKYNSRKRSVEFDANEDLTKSGSAETHSQYLGPESDTYSPPTAERKPCIVARGNVYANTQQYGSSNCQGNKQSPGVRDETGPQHGSEALNMRSHHPDIVYFQGRGRYLHDPNNAERKQEVCGEYSHKNNMDSTLLRQKSQMQEINAPPWNIGSCSPCKAQGKGYCNCSIVQRCHPAFVTQTMGNFEGDLLQNDVRYSSYGGVAPATSRLTFNEIDSLLEYNSSLSKSQNRHVQCVDRSRVQMCSTPDEVNGSAFHHSDPKTRGNILNDEPAHDQAVHSMSHKISVQDLPERITTYLANHSTVRRDMYNNNNNTCTDIMVSLDQCTSPGSSRCEQKTPLQDENVGSSVDYKLDDKKEDSLRDLVEPPSDMEDMTDSRILNGKKNRKQKCSPQKTCIKNLKGENVLQNLVRKKKKEINLTICHPASSGVENEQAINSDAVLGSSKLSDNMQASMSKAQAENQDCHPKCSSSHATTRPVTEYLHPEELNSRDERLCKSNCDMKEKRTVGFSHAASVPAGSAAAVSARARESSLYKHLSRIHFSEKSRRYEWVTQPELREHKMQKELLQDTKSRGDHSTKKKLSDVKSRNMINAVGCQSQDSITPDITDSRSESQSSDSGHYSLSLESTDHSAQLGKPVNYRDHKPATGSSHSYKSQKDQNMSPEITSNKKANYSGQYIDSNNKNSNNNNNICDASNLQCSSVERFTSPYSSQKKFDDVVKRLVFDDTVLEDSRGGNESLLINLSGQWCVPMCDGDKDMIQDKITSKILPASSEICCDKCHFLSKEGQCVHALQSVAHDNPKYIDPGSTDVCQDQNTWNLINLSHVDLAGELQVENETCADVKEYKEKESNMKEEEVDKAFDEEDIHDDSHLSDLSEEDLGEINDSHKHFDCAKNKKNNHLKKHAIVPEGDDYCNSVITIDDPGTQWNAEKIRQFLRGDSFDELNIQHYNIVFNKPANGILEDTRDSNGSIDFQARDTSGTSVCNFEDSAQVPAEKWDDTLPAFHDVSMQSDAPFMGTTLSPLSKLYRLLVESQEMINSLEKNCSMPGDEEFEEPLQASH
ncbi:hypothetical protein BsWGS_21895 [Bradybaena similaris]